VSRRVCAVFRSRRSADTYLIVDHAEGFARVPPQLLERMGGTERAMTLVLEPGRRLARTTGAEVLASIERHGYYLQLPPPPESSGGAC
jgi:uncharacterized protein YcgL (UPF0745 family)